MSGPHYSFGSDHVAEKVLRRVEIAKVRNYHLTSGMSHQTDPSHHRLLEASKTVLPLRTSKHRMAGKIEHFAQSSPRSQNSSRGRDHTGMISCQTLQVKTSCSNTMSSSRRAQALDDLRAMPSMPPSKLLNTRTSGSDLCPQLGKHLLRMECPGSKLTTSHSSRQHSKDHIHHWVPATLPLFQRPPLSLTHTRKVLRCLTFHILRRKMMTTSQCTPSTIHHQAVSYHRHLLALRHQQCIREPRTSRTVRICCYTWPIRRRDRQVLETTIVRPKNHHQLPHRSTPTCLPR